MFKNDRKIKVFFFYKKYGIGGSDVAQGVAVARWEWYRWIRQVSAVRMVQVREWQWQYWPSCDSLKNYKLF
jgi:hypothetical protein